MTDLSTCLTVAALVITESDFCSVIYESPPQISIDVSIVVSQRP